MDDSQAFYENVVETDADFEHAFTERFRSCLERLQLAVTLAHLHKVPLATACYRSSLADTINELADWFEREAAAHLKQRSMGVPR